MMVTMARQHTVKEFETSIEELPPEIIKHIAHFLYILDGEQSYSIVNLRLCCKSIRNAILPGVVVPIDLFDGRDAIRVPTTAESLKISSPIILESRITSQIQDELKRSVHLECLKVSFIQQSALESFLSSTTINRSIHRLKSLDLTIHFHQSEDQPNWLSWITSSLQSLTRLHLSAAVIQINDQQYLSQLGEHLVNLNDLKLINCTLPTDESISSLLSLKHLTSLCLHPAAFSAVGIHMLVKNLPHLQSFECAHRYAESAIAMIEHLDQLRNLKMDISNLSSNDTTFFFRCNTLLPRHLGIGSTRSDPTTSIFADSLMDHNLNKLRALHLCSCNNRDVHAVAAALPSMPYLKELCIGFNTVFCKEDSSQSLSLLCTSLATSATQLTALSIMHPNPYTMVARQHCHLAAWSQLSNLTSLKSMTFAASLGWNTNSIAHVVQCAQNLRNVTLQESYLISGMKMNGAWLKEIAALPRLMKLNIFQDNGLENEDYLWLRDATTLTSIELSGRTVVLEDEDVMRLLRESLPALAYMGTERSALSVE